MAPEDGSQVEFREEEEALSTAAQRITSWHSRIRQIYGLTSDVLRRTQVSELTVVDRENVEASALYILTMRSNLNSSFGRVSIMELSQTLTDNPSQPLISRFFYRKGDLDNLVAVSFGWRLQNSDVLYEMVAMPKGMIDKLVKITRPGVLFPAPRQDDHALTRRLAQQMEVSFSYDKGKLVGWTSEVGFEHLPGRVVFKNGNLIRRDETELGYELPKTFNPTPHIKSFMSHKRNEPLLP